MSTQHRPPWERFALIAEHHPAYAGNYGTPHLIKTLTASPWHPFCAVVATDRAGPGAIGGPWDTIPTLSLFRPRSLLANLSIGLGLLDNLAFSWQRQRAVNFMRAQRAERQFALVANNPRLALFVADLPCSLPRDLYLIDDFVADSHLYRVEQATARRALDRLVRESERVFTISPVYAADLESRYNRPCHFLPMPIAGYKLEAMEPPPEGPPPDRQQLTIHHLGQVHHLYADALADFVALLKRWAGQRSVSVRLEFWGQVGPERLAQALRTNLSGEEKLLITVEGEATFAELLAAQRRADFLLLANSFAPGLEKQVRCSLSSKISEYLVAGTPILVYAPPYSSLVAHLGGHGAAHIIATAEPEAAFNRLDQVLSRSSHRQVVQAAQALAKSQHSDQVFFQRITHDPA